MSPRTMIGQHDDRAFYGFLHWRFAYAGPAPVYAAPPSWGRHPQTFTFSTELGCPRDGQFTPIATVQRMSRIGSFVPINRHYAHVGCKRESEMAFGEAPARL